MMCRILFSAESDCSFSAKFLAQNCRFPVYPIMILYYKHYVNVAQVLALQFTAHLSGLVKENFLKGRAADVSADYKKIIEIVLGLTKILLRTAKLQYVSFELIPKAGYNRRL